MKVKVSGVRDLAQARAIAIYPVDFIGLALDISSSSAMSPTLVPDILQWIQGPKIIAEVGNTPVQKGIQLAELLGISILQFNYMKEMNNLPSNCWIELETSEPNSTLDLYDYTIVCDNPKRAQDYVSIPLSELNTNNKHDRLNVVLAENDDAFTINEALAQLF